MNFPEVAQGADKIARFHFRAFDVVPHHDGVLDQRFRNAVASPALHESGNDLDVEDPTRQKRRRKDFTHIGSRSEEFSAALRVVHRETETGGDQSRADPAEIMTRRLPADVAAEKA